MFVVNSYFLAVVLCFITMLCWGSWPNTQKLTNKWWRFELYYWDYVLGIVSCMVIVAFTMGSMGASGRSFIQDLSQADSQNLWSAFFSGVLFNFANILFVAAITYAGMSVAFPLGGGVGLILGVSVNYFATPSGDPVVLFAGVFFILIAMIFSGTASRKHAVQTNKMSAKGIALAIVAGIFFGLFYRFLAIAMTSDFNQPEAGSLTPYTGLVWFALGVFISNIPINIALMKRPFNGEALSIRSYFEGHIRDHFMGWSGGMIWGLGLSFAILSSGMAGFAISFGLSQANALVAAVWGVFVWKEFNGASFFIKVMLLSMFLFYVMGIVLITLSNN